MGASHLLCVVIVIIVFNIVLIVLIVLLFLLILLLTILVLISGSISTFIPADPPPDFLLISLVSRLPIALVVAFYAVAEVVVVVIMGVSDIC